MAGAGPPSLYRFRQLYRELQTLLFSRYPGLHYSEDRQLQVRKYRVRFFRPPVCGVCTHERDRSEPSHATHRFVFCRGTFLVIHVAEPSSWTHDAVLSPNRGPDRMAAFGSSVAQSEEGAQRTATADRERPGSSRAGGNRQAVWRDARISAPALAN